MKKLSSYTGTLSALKSAFHNSDMRANIDNHRDFFKTHYGLELSVQQFRNNPKVELAAEAIEKRTNKRAYTY